MAPGITVIGPLTKKKAEAIVRKKNKEGTMTGPSDFTIDSLKKTIPEGGLSASSLRQGVGKGNYRNVGLAGGGSRQTQDGPQLVSYVKTKPEAKKLCRKLLRQGAKKVGIGEKTDQGYPVYA